MAAAHLVFNYNCILVCEISFSNRLGHPKLTNYLRVLAIKILLRVVFIAQINHYGKFTTLRKLISIVL